MVDDGSSDDTVGRGPGGRRAGTGARHRAGSGNPALARNRGAGVAAGDPLVFLDADCIPVAGWLAGCSTLMTPARRSVGGSLDLPPGLPPMARCDYYCGWYHVHSRRPAGEVPNHPPGNLSVRRAAFRATRGLHRAATGGLRPRRAGLAGRGSPDRRPHPVRARAPSSYHYNRPGFGNLLAPQLSLGLQRDREQGADRRPPAWPGSTATPGCWWLAQPSAGARQRRATSCGAGFGRERSSHCSCSRRPGRPARLLRRTGRGRRPVDALSGQAAAERPAPVGVSGLSRLTAAVCTHERPDRDLARALDSLRQAAPAVGGDPRGGQRAAGRRDARAGRRAVSGVRYVREPVPGLDFARNRALATAGGDVVAFLDDDAVADAGLGRPPRRRASRATPTVGACTGRVEPLGARDARAQRLFEANGGFCRGTGAHPPAGRRRPPAPRPAAPLIAWAVSVGSGCSLRRPAATALAARRVRRGARPGCRAPGRRRPRSALAGAAGGPRGGLRARRACLARAPPRASRRCTTRSWATSARCSRSSTKHLMGAGARRGPRCWATRLAAGQAGRPPAAPRGAARSAARAGCSSACGGTAGWDCWPIPGRGGWRGGAGSAADERRSLVAPSASGGCGGTASCCGASWCATSR